MKKSKSHQNDVTCSTIHGIQFMPDKLRKSRTRQTEKNLSNVASKHYDHVDEIDEPLVNGQCHGGNTEGEGDDSWLSFKYPFENIVLSGGGSKGYAYVGALKALEDCGVLRQVKRVAGSSAGAICGALLAVGCTPQEIATVWAGDNNYVKWIFQDQECPCCCCLPRVWTSFGVHASDRFYDILGEYFTKKTSKPDLTFAELYSEYGRELYIAVTNLTKLCSEYCDMYKTPDLPIRKAVRMSMSFPVFFEPVRHNLNGSTACIYTDGGTLDQYPISAFDGKDMELNHNEVNNQTAAGPLDNRSLGFYLMSECATDHKIWHSIFGTSIPTKPTYLPHTKLARKRLKEEAKRRKAFTPHKSLSQLQAEMKVTNPDTGEMMHYSLTNNDHVHIKNLGQYFSTSIEALLISQRRLHIRPTDVRRTVAINCGYIGTSDYTIEPGDREFLIRQGYAHVMQFLQAYSREHSGQQATVEQVPTSSPDGPLSGSKTSSTVDIQVEIDNLASELAELDTKMPSASASVPGLATYLAESHSRRGSNTTAPPSRTAPLAAFDAMTPEHSSSSANSGSKQQCKVGSNTLLNGLENEKIVSANDA